MSKGDKTLITNTLVGMTFTGSERRSACLVQFSGSDVGKPHFVEVREAIIGRDPRADVRLDEQNVSKSHCRLILRSTSFAIEDMGSLNGTYVNDKKIKGTTELRDGDLVRIGGVSLKFFAPGSIEQLLFDKVYREKMIDEKTKVFNDKYLMTTLRSEMKLARSFKQPLSLLIYDLDFFKKVNDTFGHDVGDFILKGTAEIVSEVVRKNDDLCRYGGEEFVVILRDTKIETGVRLAERMRRAVASHAFKIKHGGVTIKHMQTMSIGVAMLKPGIKTAEEFIKACDVKLYEAKHGGRNRVAS